MVFATPWVHLLLVRGYFVSHTGHRTASPREKHTTRCRKKLKDFLWILEKVHTSRNPEKVVVYLTASLWQIPHWVSQPNARGEPRPEAEARHERKL
jgi:hypothetical protein